MSRRRRRWWIVAVVVVVLAGAAVAAVLLFSGKKTPAARYLTATASTGTIANTVQADFTLASAREAMANSSSSSGTTISTSQSGVVTALNLSVGRAPRTLQRLVTVSGVPVFAFVSATPLYETLSTSLASGVELRNVKVLQAALKAGGYYTGDVDGTFGSGTQTAIEAWQADNDLTETGKIDVTQFVWVPSGAVLGSLSVSVGSQLNGQGTLGTVVFPRQLAAQANVSQADISSLKVGQTAQLTIDGGIGGSFAGTISYIDSQPASSSSTSSSSGTASYTVTFRLKSIPAKAKSGMTGSLEVTIAKRANVLLVPTRAVVGSSTTSYVQVMIDGKPVMRQVTTGLATASFTQVTSGLSAGEVVMTGVYSNSATTAAGNAATTTRRSNGLGSGLSGGTFQGPPAGFGGGQ
jgi:peptidoglycan hydrolase-like protein with peptidoglycan-binding domain